MSANFWPSRSSSVSSASKKPQNASYSLETVEEEGQLHPSSSSSSTASCETPPNAEKTVQCFTPPRGELNDQEKLKPILKNSSMKSANVFRISIQDNLDKLVELPSLCVWDRLESPGNFMRGRLAIQLKTKGFLIRRETGWMGCYCLISRQGHLIQGKEDHHICGKVHEISDGKKVLKKYCLLTVKWKFGAISINLLENQFKSGGVSSWMHMSRTFNRILSRRNNDVVRRAHFEDVGNADGNEEDRDSSSLEFSTSVGKVSQVAEKSALFQPPNTVRRRHSEAAWMHSKSRYDKKPLPEWINDFGTANRFRLTKDYFENYEG
uniref:Uncharacterized protein n=1 Tax=Ditylenchus dipsaci TaxID=166011 RepID=A0A915DXP8_9BILA